MSAAAPRTAVGVGADATIAKPFDLDDLDALLERFLSNLPKQTV
jgi:DNA-binding response OmpR family regulator